MKKKTLLKLIALKQEEGLLKWLFMPFWKALTGTIILIAFCFVCSGSFFILVMLAPVIAFGIYMSRKCQNRLKELKEFGLNPRYTK
ncbi:hypothetical protein ES705_33596 [subsurface metagenome]